MLAHRIKEFINELSLCDHLNDYDRQFHIFLSQKFAALNNDEVLDEDHIKFILNIFAQRWTKVVDTELDYTFNPCKENEGWIKLAKDLAEDQSKTYLQILIPTVENTVDPILLSRLTECTELRGFYVSQDLRTLHRVRGLFERVQKKYHFSTFKNPNDTTSKALTVIELYRIQAKVGHLDFDFRDVVYVNFWDYFKRAVLPTWRSRGTYPFSLLPSLLELVNAESPAEFREKLRAWERDLQEYSVEEINALYGQVISLDDVDYYLVEILISCLSNENFSHRKMLGLVKWIAQQDYSLISSQNKFVDVYRDLGVGAHLTRERLLVLVSELQDCRSSRGTKQLATVIHKLRVATEINNEIVNNLREVFRERWLKIMGGSKDYTRLQSGINQSWIKLAQILAGAGLIEPNYYRLLMPTLNHDTDPVQLEMLVRFPLSHFVLSEDGRQLILLSNSALRYKDTRTFYNCNTTPVKPFTKIELDRIEFAHKKFHKYLQNMRVNFEMEDPSISINTVMAIKTLVDGSLYPNGLIFSRDYNETQMATAEKAYQVFYKFLHDLPDDELHRLNAQRIFFHGRTITFSEVMLKVKEEECIAVYGQYFAQMVIDYAPHLYFRAEIESQAAIDEMRVNSRKKIVREYDHLTDEEALSRLHILFISIMSQDFQYLSFAGYTEYCLGYKNIIPYEARTILMQLKPMLDSRNLKAARSLYCSIIEGTAKTLVASNSWHTTATRYASTQDWLESIADQSLFTNPKFWFEPETILACLIPVLIQASPLQLKIQSFLDRTVHLLLSSNNMALAKLHINMKFMQLLKSLNQRSQTQLLERLSEGESVDRNQLHPLCMEVLKLRIASIFADEKGSRSFRVFSNRPSRKAYDDALKAIVIDGKNINQIQDSVFGLLENSSSDTTTSAISQYWKQMTGRPMVRLAPDVSLARTLAT
jgi:hypothetical protein